MYGKAKAVTAAEIFLCIEDIFHPNKNPININALPIKEHAHIQF
jgi:hypothetical protein